MQYQRAGSTGCTRTSLLKIGYRLFMSKLPPMRMRVLARCDAADCNVQRWKNVHLESEKGSGECLQWFERKAPSGRECVQWLQVELAPHRTRSMRLPTDEVRKALARLRMICEPVIGARYR